MIYINSITFSDGSTLSFKENDIVVFVGANNAGKSASLKEIIKSIKNNSLPTTVIKHINVVKKANTDKFLNYLADRSTLEINSSNGMKYYKGIGYDIFEASIRSQWESESGLGDVTTIMVNLLSTEDRLNAANAPQSIAITKAPPSHPIHYLQKDDKIEIKFSNYFRHAFNQDLIVHRNAGNSVPLYVGDRPIPLNGEDRISASYLERLESLSLLQEQGDGMRGFVGVLLNTFISNHAILLIDEPEAFLHPPQARLLGKMLGKDLPISKQLFLSTHSEYFLKGLLDSNNPNLKIIRINRDNNINNVSLIDSDEINTIWNDSLLRHSNILDGLFHSQVVLCESDSDCRFFSAMLTTLCESKGATIPDIHFVQSSGKHRFPIVIKALKKLNVPLKVIGDIDLLNNDNPIKQIYEAVGGNWIDIEKEFKMVKSAVDHKKPELLCSDLKKEVDNIFSSISEKVMPKEKIKAIEKQLVRASPWSEAKSAGRSYLPSGDATLAFDTILKKLEEKGIYILDVGEIEAFDKTVGGHGPNWVNKVLEKDLLNSSDLKQAREFVEAKLL